MSRNDTHHCDGPNIALFIHMTIDCKAGDTGPNSCQEKTNIEDILIKSVMFGPSHNPAMVCVYFLYVVMSFVTYLSLYSLHHKITFVLMDLNGSSHVVKT